MFPLRLGFSGVYLRIMRTLLAGLALLTSALACAPSRGSKSAGSIGCPPDEIQISDEDSSSGWGSSADTWVATCRGRRFICSENTVTASSGKGGVGISQGLACTEEISEDSAASKAGSAAPSGNQREDKAPRVEPPRTAAGFEFGADPAAMQKVCEGSGKTWNSSNAKAGVCSGPAVDVGFEVKVRVDFCNGLACAITLVHFPAADWIKAFSGLKGKLAEKYNTPVAVFAAIPEECHQEAQFLQCLENDSLRLKFRWEWPTNQKIDLSIGKPEKGEGPVAIRVKYINPQGAVRANVDAL